MAGKVFFSVTMSLDGFIAPEERMDDPDVERWTAQWMELQQWIFPQRFFRENLKLGEGGEEGRDNDIARETFERTGASVMGKRMFDAGEDAWPEEAPFHTPVFVVTHTKRDPCERLGGTTRPLAGRSEEHTSELQSHLNLVCRLLLEKKKDKRGSHCINKCLLNTAIK